MCMLRHLLIFIILISVMRGRLSGQALLDRQLSFQCEQMRFDDALGGMAEAGDFFFAYSPNMLPREKTVSLNLAQTTVAEGLEAILVGTSLTYRVVGKHVILRKKAPVPRNPPVPQAPLAPPKTYRLSGQIRDTLSQRALSGVYIDGAPTKELQTDASGRFDFRASPGQTLSLIFHKQGYRPASLSLAVNRNYELGIIELVPLLVQEIEPRLQEATLIEPRNPMSEVFLVDLLVEDSLLDTDRLQPPLKGFPLQLSLLPVVSTRGGRGRHYQNSLSFNLVAGYVGSVKGIELGGVLNAVRQEMVGVQMGGVGNVVGGYAKGLQAAGVLNVNLSNMAGLQLAGVLNTATGLQKGAQFAGIANVLTYRMRGIQMAGILNIAPGNIKGAQISGLLNLNFSQVKGIQLSGIYNHARRVSGVQIGLINWARHARGIQIGLVNVADTVRGIPIGLVNVIRKGYQGVEIGASEIWPLQMSIKLGLPWWYTIFTAKAAPDDGALQYGYAAGLGSVLMPRKRLQPKIEGTISGWARNSPPGTHLQFRFLLEWNRGKRFYAQGGPAVNWFIAYDDTSLDPAGDLLPYALWQRVELNQLRQQFWLGFYVSLGFRKNFLLG